MADKKGNYIGTLVGCAVGDTLGMPVEMWKREQIKKHVGRITEPIAPFFVKDGDVILKEDEFGKIRYYAKGRKKGDWTDDTMLAVAIAEALAENGLDLDAVAKRHLAEYKSRIQKDGTVIGGFGRTTVDAFKQLQKGISPQESGVIGGPGNGPAMKMAPLGLYMAAHGNYEGGLKFAGEISSITHLDPRSIVSGVLQAHAVYSILQDPSRDEFLESLVRICSVFERPLTEEFRLPEEGNLTSRIKWIVENKDAEPEAAYQNIGTSSLIMNSYPFALFMFQKYWDKPIEGLLETVNYGGDCDTTGAIYGALCGAKNGMIFPKEWTKTIHQLERIIAVAGKIYALRRGSSRNGA